MNESRPVKAIVLYNLIVYICLGPILKLYNFTVGLPNLKRPHPLLLHNTNNKTITKNLFLQNKIATNLQPHEVGKHVSMLARSRMLVDKVGYLEKKNITAICSR